MSEGPDHGDADEERDAAFIDVLNGITGGAPRRSGERRGLFRRRRAEPEAEAPADGEGTGPMSAADRDAARALDEQDAARPGERSDGEWTRGGAHRSPPQGVPIGPPSDQGTPPSGWRPDVTAPGGPWPGPRYPGGPGAEVPPTAPIDPTSGRHDIGAPSGPPPAGNGEPAERESSFVRPYAWTRGRTRPAYDLAIEALLTTTAVGRDPAVVTQVEHRMIADLCHEPRSVAEVAALLSLPLGVARVLLGDMAAQGSIVVHETASSSGSGPDLALMERVLSGLRRL